MTSSSDRQHRADSSSEWLRRAAVHAGAGLLFSLVVSVCVTIGLAAGFTSIAAAERAGADFTSRIFVFLLGGGEASGSPADRYALVDVDPAACAAFAPAGQCDSGRPIPDRIIVPLVKAIASKGASAILVDVPLPGDDGERKAMCGALAQIDGPWIVLPYDTRPDQNSNGLVAANDGCTSTGGRIRMAAFATVTAASGDGLVRDYPAQVLQRFASRPTARPVRVATAPALAAQLVTGRDGHPSPPPGMPPRQGTGIFYSLPPVSAGLTGPDADNALEYLVASRMLNGQDFVVPKDRLAGRTVIISSTSAQGLDTHLTPLGPLSGGEVLLNATRTYVHYRPSTALAGQLDPAQAIDTLLAKARSALLPAMVVLIAVFAREAIVSTLRVSGMILPILVSSLSLVIFFSGFVLDIIEGVTGIEEAARAGRQVDLVTPAILTGLDLYRELANSLMKLFESWIVALITAPARAIRWIGAQLL
ncbi:CHASE2 domain-containing protein [Novosphingobium sp. MD-1]|uniref:CHASE2 domain-containing protein n=1 Tax=Novosphingobium sp. MD-1 TaxID=1630648 RepID=UPI00061C0A7C|nr:CHASE2 domain-containing protein [Novosphingobium sp. MD-1]GAO53201.1 hypothetical protein NMD1_00207 [Novosphingobium sp. MD-1]